MKHLLVSIASLCLVSCSTITPSERVARDAFIGGTVGYIAGQQSSKNPDMYSAAYGGLGVGIGAMVGLLLHDPEQVPRKIQNENEALRRQISEMQEPRVERATPGTLGGYIPARYRSLVQPGSWKVLEIDQWIEDGENRLVHQDKVMELVPPSLVPAGR